MEQKKRKMCVYEMPRLHSPGYKRLAGVLYNPTGKVSEEAKMDMRYRIWRMCDGSQLLSFSDGRDGEVVLCWEMHDTVEIGFGYLVKNKLRKLVATAFSKMHLDDFVVPVVIEIDPSLTVMDGTSDRRGDTAEEVRL